MAEWRHAACQAVISKLAEIKLELLYGMVTVVSGLILICNDRYPARNDRGTHWRRAQQIASGQWLPQPSPDGRDLWGWYNPDGVFEAFNNTAVNSPFAYYPSLVAGFIRQHDFALASVVTLLCSTIAVIAAIRLAGSARYAVAAVALLPTVFFSFTFPTADAVTNAVSLLIMAYVFRCRQCSRLTWPHIIGLSVLAVACCLSKSTCVMLLLPVVMLGFAADPDAEEGRRRFRCDWRVLIPAACGSAAFLAWTSRIGDIPPLIGSNFDLAQYQEAKRLLLGHPADFVRTLWVTLIQPLDLNAEFDRHNMARNLQLFTGTEDTMLPNSVMLCVLLACVLLALKGSGFTRMLLPSDRAALVLTVIGFYVLTCAAMMLVGRGVVLTADRLGTYADGMQSRYFVPVLVPLLALLPDFGLRVRKTITLNMWIGGLVVCGYALLLCSHLTEFVIV
ncbi:hypothetical protein DSM100688_0612 [Bifidobacterium ramosum]|uniref:DUF2142 domain-containing protein n=1 Tax=Bifidobacterium ramosum TaxID=1798158 RepID=A0A6L4X1Z1_9BIFI|nr:DUF2142 domain-containing protein [Bifidobacterium ramosum]KAB8288610.1 hypothetical protein DSM100688_0612 [Bifidobacterium ramosum]NEG71813.1 DUF2142 domain-containing protein [Bifidobacterium ramosum]